MSVFSNNVCWNWETILSIILIVHLEAILPAEQEEGWKYEQSTPQLVMIQWGGFGWSFLVLGFDNVSLDPKTQKIAWQLALEQEQRIEMGQVQSTA